MGWPDLKVREAKETVDEERKEAAEVVGAPVASIIRCRIGCYVS